MFKFVRTIGGQGRKLTKPIRFADSQTVAVGDFVKSYTTGQLVLGTAANLGLGVVVAIVDSKGMPIQVSNPVAGTASGVNVTSVATGTSGVYYGIVDFGIDTLYSVDVNGTLGSTASSQLRGCHIDVDSANTNYGKVLETTATRTEGVEANFYSHGVDPNDSTRLLVNLVSSEVFSTWTT